MLAEVSAGAHRSLKRPRKNEDPRTPGGKDPAYEDEAARKREKVRDGKREQAVWETQYGATTDPDVFQKEILPHLKSAKFQPSCKDNKFVGAISLPHSGWSKAAAASCQAIDTSAHIAEKSMDRCLLSAGMEMLTANE